MNSPEICIKSRVQFSCMFDALDHAKCLTYLFLSSEGPGTESTTLSHEGVFFIVPCIWSCLSQFLLACKTFPQFEDFAKGARSR